MFTGDKAGSEETTRIGLVYGQEQTLAEQLETTWSNLPSTSYEFVKYETADEATLNKDIEAGVIEGYLKFEAQEGNTFPTVVYTSEDEAMSPELQSICKRPASGEDSQDRKRIGFVRDADQ